MRYLKKFKLPLAALVVGSLLSQVIIPVSATELDLLHQQQQSISQEIKKQEEKLKQNKNEMQTANREIEQLDRAVVQVQSDIDSLIEKIAATEQKVTAAEVELAEAQERFAERTDVLAARVREIFINGQVNYLEVILQATSINDFLTRLVLMEKLMEQDMILLDEIEAERVAIEEKEESLENKKAEIVTLKLDTERKKQELLKNNQDKQRWIVSLQSDTAMLAKALDELEETSNQIAQQIRAAQAKNGNSGQGITGKLVWPVDRYTRISSQYGMRLHPILKTNRMHAGIDIPAPTGTKIFAAESGRVITAGWAGSYGQTIIIDHGKGMSTLYAHQSKLLAKEGDKVKRGQVIGEMGSTGRATGPNMHFEVRENGAHTNPLPYLR